MAPSNGLSMNAADTTAQIEMAPMGIHPDEEEDYELQDAGLEEAPFIPTDSSGIPGAHQFGLKEGEDPRDKYRWRVLILTFLIAPLTDVAIVAAMPAWTALLEKGICSEMHPDIASTLVVGVDNPLCKEPAVQGKLAMYRGWSYTLDAIPTILLSIPLGSLSDKVGRKPIGSAALIGIFVVMLAYQFVFYFQLPMWTYLLCSLWHIIGGGPPVAISMMYTMMADVVHTENMASVLFRFNSSFLIAELVSTPLGGFLLGQGPWVALVTSNAIMAGSLFMLFSVPETLAIRQWHDARSGRIPTKFSSPSAADRLPHAPRPAGLRPGKRRTWVQAGVDAAREQIQEVWHFISLNKRASVLILPFVFVSLGKYIQELLMQYATKRYGWSWSKASYFLTLKSASFVVMLTFVLPYLSTVCIHKLKMSPLAKDLWLSRWSVVLLILADAVITVSSTPALYGTGLVLLAGGCGIGPLLRSLLNAIVEPHHIGVLNTLVSFLETAGIMVAAPVFSWALQRGLEMGGVWMGLPFAVGTAVTCIAAGIIWVYRLPRVLEGGVVLLEGDHAD